MLAATSIASSQTVTVLAAASLQGALDETAATAGGIKIVVSYAASSALARQIENGAPADVFISADLDWMDYLGQRKLINAATRVNLLRNRLVLVAPASSKVVVELKSGVPLAALLGNSRLAMADPDSVPAGKYARAALEALGVWTGVAPKLARAENVRAALLLVSRGEAPFGIVYSTDAIAAKGVRVVATFAADLHPPIVYPAALLASSKNTAAGELLAHLRSPAARAVWQKYGFSSVE